MTAVFSSAYFPPVSYFMELVKHEGILMEQMENYPKQTWRNRCNIYGPNGLQALSIPVDKEGRAKVMMKDLKISRASGWQKNHLRSIETAYNTSPYFIYYRDELLAHLEQPQTWLMDMNMHILELCIKLLKISCNISLSGQYVNDYGHIMDFRYSLGPKLPYSFALKPYYQVFIDKHGFIPNLSILDLICNEGPAAGEWLA